MKISETESELLAKELTILILSIYAQRISKLPDSYGPKEISIYLVQQVLEIQTIK